MSYSTLKQLCKWYFATKIPLHLAIVFSLVFIIFSLYLSAYYFETFPKDSTIVSEGIGVYWDANCDNPVNELRWGPIFVDLSRYDNYKQIYVYVRNEMMKSTVLELGTSEWYPYSTDDFINLSWDYQFQILQPNETRKITLSLHVNSSIWTNIPRIQKFSFQIRITSNP